MQPVFLVTIVEIWRVYALYWDQVGFMSVTVALSAHLVSNGVIVGMPLVLNSLGMAIHSISDPSPT